MKAACLRLAIVALASLQGLVLLLHLQGGMTLRSGMLWLALPALAGLSVLAAAAARKRGGLIAAILCRGTLGGLAGTLAYDLVRLPAMWAGRDVFAPIEMYGLWIADGAAATVGTEALGWTYHFANGTCFGVMYAAFMTGRHWGWGVAWGMVLETIAVLSPFGLIFNLYDARTLAIAYAGHVAYGVPLGRIVQGRRGTTYSRVTYTPTVPAMTAGAGAWCTLLAVGLLALAAPARVPPGMAATLEIRGGRLEPRLARVTSPGRVVIRNPGGRAASLITLLPGAESPIPAGAVAELSAVWPGIHPLRLDDRHGARHSFVIVEPVHRHAPPALPPNPPRPSP